MPVGKDDVHAELRRPVVYTHCEIYYLATWVSIVTGDRME